MTGRFPMRSSQGNEYILVGYHYNGDYIHRIPIKNRTTATLTAVWKQLHKLFAKAGALLDIWIMDNEVFFD